MADVAAVDAWPSLENKASYERERKEGRRKGQQGRRRRTKEHSGAEEEKSETERGDNERMRRDIWTRLAKLR